MISIETESADQFRIILSSDKDAFTYVFLSNDKGERAMLFPDVKIPNLIKANTEYVIPGVDWYELDENGGTTENIHVVVSRRPVAALERSRGLDLSPDALAKFQQMSFRGVRKKTRPAVMAQRLKEAKVVVEASGSSENTSIKFKIDHR